ncbi:hypothetical protein D8B26_007947 [Coccidioides posadasii str. Silveira]|uniref:uncharacterized protein n=1 Tax=Coccidioides posadasii (strain RMSCC 757 / Silveira) TaxID=443226 RepID=UPI001BEEABE7|nr:hypothetical protein D8B26_007947 [Coccidioides posadasii str. Silveira]
MGPGAIAMSRIPSVYYHQSTHGTRLMNELAVFPSTLSRSLSASILSCSAPTGSPLLSFTMVRNHSDRARWPCMLDIPRLISETAYKRLATRASSPSASAIRVAKNIETPRGPLSSKEVVTHGNCFGCKQAAGPLLSDLTRT